MNTHRGIITNQEILKKAKAFFGENFGQGREVRLLAHLDYCLKNGGRVSLRDLYPEEVSILENWLAKGWLDWETPTHLSVVSKEFYDVMSEILWDAYVNKEAE